MRTKLLIFSTTVAAAVVCAAWFVEHVTSIRLDAELAASRATQREREILISESKALRARLPDSDRLASLRAEHAERDVILVELAKSSPVASPDAPIALGETMAWRSWRNRGQATPRAAMETTLWAAAGGDLLALESMLELEPATRAAAETLLSALPANARNLYSTPEKLIASATLKNSPLGDAQIAWFRQVDADHATIGVFLTKPDPSAPPVHEPGLAGDRPPPSLPPSSAFKLSTLTLQRSNSGWRLVVPPSAIDRLAGELTAAK
jgi:hypothetical protein